MRFVWPAAILTIVVAGLVFATEQELRNIAPDSLVPNWSVMKDSAVYAKGKGLVDIYNGGYEHYTDNGVLEALRKMYEQKDSYIEVTVHKMKSADAGKAFLAKRHKIETGKPAPTTKTFKRFTAAHGNSVVGYSLEGVFLMTVGAFESAPKGQKNVSSFLTAMEQKAKPKKK